MATASSVYDPGFSWEFPPSLRVYHCSVKFPAIAVVTPIKIGDAPLVGSANSSMVAAWLPL